ncbi:ComEC family protein [Dryocola clanedunensis]|uniref:ComEC family protein n=1 Tax=Cedecea sulfonylureivorans TaxID=3051154 RepID=UPI0019264A5F
MLNLPGLCISVIAGIVPLLWLPAIPESHAIAVLLAAGLCLLIMKQRTCRYVAIFVMTLCWGLLAARESLEPFEKLVRKPIVTQVVITRTDGAQKHELQITRVDNHLLFPPVGVVLKGVSLPASVCQGQKWLMTLRLSPVHGQLNEGGFDSQRYALAQHTPLRGKVVKATRLSEACTSRAQWMARVTTATQRLKWQGIIMALSFGERAGMTSEVKSLLRLTGTAHLMAISGLHISLAAGIGWLLARCCQFLLPAHRVDYRLPLLASLFTAVVYCWLAGGNPPAIRALTGLTFWTALRLTGRQWSGWDVWLCCVAGILFCDPLTLLSDSFWLSALAVAGLIFWYQWMPLPRVLACSKWYIRYPVGLVHLQVGITLLLIPLQIFMFHGISINALLANLIAVPFVSFLVVPLLLAGLMLTAIPWVNEAIWLTVDTLLGQLFFLLHRLPGGWLELDSRFLAISLCGWLAIIVYRLGLWRISPASVAVLGVCLGTLSTGLINKKDPSSWEVTMLDVGHGLAVAIVRHGRAILYDTGGAWPAGDAAQQAIIPWLRWKNITPEGVIISHEHLDHRGGLNSLLKAWPTLEVRSSLGWVNHRPCFEGQSWKWQQLDFTVHWPPAGSDNKGNNGSCVVMVSDGHFRLLLTGDVEAGAELAMLKGRWRTLEADIIQVPHHGSRTSSGSPLLRAVSGQVALASASRYNAWHLPSVKVTERYLKQGYQWYDTAHTGQISIRINSDKWQIIGFREQILPRWYHQWFGVTQYSR